MARQLRDPSIVRRCRGKLTEGRTYLYDEDRSGRPSLMTPELMESVQKVVLQNQRFTNSGLAGQFLQVSRSFIATRNRLPVRGKVSTTR